MILIGQYDSPFVRRVGIALRLYGIAFEHRPWSVFGDAEKIRAFNPLIRVPTLVLDDGFVLIDSHMILDHLDALVGPARALFPQAEPDRHLVLKVTTLATGLAEKAVSLFYERQLHGVTSPTWEARCALQIGSVLAALEADRAARSGEWWFKTLTHADIAVACALRFVLDTQPGVLRTEGFPALTAHAERMDMMPEFQEIFQTFIPPS